MLEFVNALSVLESAPRLPVDPPRPAAKRNKSGPIRLHAVGVSDAVSRIVGKTPAMLRGTIAPDRSTTLPPEFCLHLPVRMNYATTLHSRMKCPVPPQKFQTLSLAALALARSSPPLSGMDASAYRV